MQIEHLLVDGLQIDSSSLSGVVNSVRYDFAKPEWISSHRERPGKSLGPMTLLETGAEYELITFPERKLRTQGPPAHTIFHFTDTWTIPARTVYAISLPQYYVDNVLSVRFHIGEGENQMNRGISKDDRIFYFLVLENSCIANIRARIIRNDEKYYELADSVEVVKNSSKFGKFFKGFGKELLSPKTWVDAITQVAVDRIIPPPSKQ